MIKFEGQKHVSLQLV